ncbi:MAG: sensor domain-containing diguanylate cyclase [Oceanospirillaceae bacterium]|jgi:diguanylate cyclase (GGDEF)-like protein|uniref:sensor domain-containing diguanylate cyclase n=1 Tax=Marinobacterium litorale TaxID=404770 RepID=UPI000408873F|nr:diguanylate cyclase [Marinobacterium litorale]MBT00762.1 sensor domain-containing diguanylate cyclase [Oceanospirillaceae bacterium]
MSQEQTLSIDAFHWHIGLLQNLDVGLVVLDQDHKIHLWNTFMANHSGRTDSEVREQDLFQLFPELPKDWFRRKLETVFMLRNRAFITWQERPYLFHFKPDRPITGKADHMYQNVTLIPLTSPDGTVRHVGVLIYDMTDAAMSHLDLEVANQELSRLSRTDRLTGLFNRGYWEECLEHEHDRFLRSGNTSSLIMLDIDHFKQINDTFGHPAGDEAIRRLAELIREHTRSTDTPGRYGGEEFGILLPDTPADRAEILAERLRKAAQNTVVVHEGERIQFTISLGIAEASGENGEHTGWLSRADEALYHSKQNGRNQTTIS